MVDQAGPVTYGRLSKVRGAGFDRP